jgi:hypothetical protein
MGQIIIEIPQSGNHTYRILSEETAKKLLQNLERLLEKEKRSTEDEDILSLWTARDKPIKKAA